MSCWSREELEQMLEDVVNELDLSDAALEEHGLIHAMQTWLTREDAREMATDAAIVTGVEI